MKEEEYSRLCWRPRDRPTGPQGLISADDEWVGGGDGWLLGEGDEARVVWGVADG